MGKFYRDYSDFLAGKFGGRIQKLTVDAGFSCPNRDGTVGYGGCIYCNNTSFSPSLGGSSVTAQLEAGKRFFRRKYPHMRYLAYFQSYTNTHGDIKRLMELYREALAVEQVEGLIIGTRPDCIPDSLLYELSGIGKPVIMEYGAESSHDSTLGVINRCHTWGQTVDAVERTVAAGMPVGLHLIMGLPGETDEMMLETVRRVACIGVDTVKLHQLQAVKGTALARESVRDSVSGVLSFRGVPIREFTVDEYLDLCVRIVDTINRLNPDMAIERFTSQAPEGMLEWPRWGLKNYQFTNLLHKRLNAMCRL